MNNLTKYILFYNIAYTLIRIFDEKIDKIVRKKMIMKALILPLAMLVCSFTVFAQTDMTKEIKSILNSGSVVNYNAKLVGASTGKTNTKTLYITETPNNIYFMALNSAYGNYATSHLTLSPMMTAVPIIFKKYPELQKIEMYFVGIEDNRDKYGKSMGIRKRIITYYGMTRETSEKIDWKYVKKELVQIDVTKIMKMCDEVRLGED